MDKSKLTGWLLIASIFMAWMFYNVGEQEKILHEKELAAKDSIQMAEKLVGSEEKNKVLEKKEVTIAENTDDFEDSSENVEQRAFLVETKYYVISLNSKGAGITSIRVKDLIGKSDSFYPEILPDGGLPVLSLKLGKYDLSEKLWKVDKGLPSEFKVEGDPLILVFSTNLASGQAISRKYTFFSDSQFIKHEFSPDELNMEYSILWSNGLKETEVFPKGKGIGLTSNFFSEVIINNGSSVLRETPKAKQSFNESSGVLKWVGLRRKYVAALINFNRETDNKVTATALIENNGEEDLPPSYALEVSNKELIRGALDFNFVVIPLHYSKIIAYQQGYEKILFSGWESIKADIWYVKLCGIVLNTLNKFYSIVPNYGLAIILLTLLVRGCLLPLTITQTKSMGKLQEHAPAIKEIKEKFKGNPQKANLEVMAYYKREGVNPVAPMIGCLPMLLQFPVFIALFHVLGRAVELKEAPFFSWISDLSRPDVIIEAIQIPYIFPEGLTILPFFMAITMYFQMKMTITDPNQKAMIYMMPIMMLLFSASFPSGLVLYWTVSNVFTIGQTALYKKNKPLISTARDSKTIPKKIGGKKMKKV